MRFQHPPLEAGWAGSPWPSGAPQRPMAGPARCQAGPKGARPLPTDPSGPLGPCCAHQPAPVPGKALTDTRIGRFALLATGHRRQPPRSAMYVHHAIGPGAWGPCVRSPHPRGSFQVAEVGRGCLLWPQGCPLGLTHGFLSGPSSELRRAARRLFCVQVSSELAGGWTPGLVALLLGRYQPISPEGQRKQRRPW